MTNEEKINDILNRKYGYEIKANDKIFWTRQYQGEVARLQEIVEWKEEQFAKVMDSIIEKFNDYPYAVFTRDNIIEVFKTVRKAMKGE